MWDVNARTNWTKEAIIKEFDLNYVGCEPQLESAREQTIKIV